MGEHSRYHHQCLPATFPCGASGSARTFPLSQSDTGRGSGPGSEASVAATRDACYDTGRKVAYRVTSGQRVGPECASWSPPGPPRGTADG